MSENREPQASTDTKREIEKEEITMECMLAIYIYIYMCMISLFSSVIEWMLLL